MIEPTTPPPEYRSPSTIVTRFNPYREWLGIKTSGKPTYYQLLNLSPREFNPQEVRRQAIIQLQKVAKVESKRHAKLQRQITDRINRAAQCLSDEHQKSNYDQRLKDLIRKQNQQQSERTANDRPVPATPKGPSQEASAAQDTLNVDSVTGPPILTRQEANLASAPSSRLPVRRERSNIARNLSKQRKRSKAVLISTGLFLLSVIGIGYLAMTQTKLGKSIFTSAIPSDPSESTAESDVVQTESASTTQNRPATETKRETPSKSPPMRTPASTQSTAPGVVEADAMMVEMQSEIRESKRSVTKDELVTLGKLLTDAKTALGNQDLTQAAKLLSEAEPFARRPEDQKKLQRLVKLHSYVSDYWQATKSELARIDSGSEIEIGGTIIIVVEKTSRELTIRAAGRNKTYLIDKLPLALAIALADRWLPPSADSTKVLRGAMMAVNPTFSKAEVREIWRAGQVSGDIDLEGLEAILDDNYRLEE